MRLLRWRHEPLPDLGPSSVLPFGNGRSYGDSCLNDGGLLLDMRGLDRLISFDVEHGVIRCEAGVMLGDILDLTVPAGWFLPVSPGTKFVTVGGAIANDVHGKNHHCAGSFGCHVRQLELLRSDGSRRRCSRTENPEWFGATIAGLGLTGVILWAEIQLHRVAGAAMDIETMRFADLGEFFRLTGESDASFNYTVAWVDCASRGKSLGRGVFTRGNHASDDAASARPPGSAFGIPIELPAAVVTDTVVRTFNAWYYRRPRRRFSRIHFDSFLYPLDRHPQLESYLRATRLLPVPVCSWVIRRARGRGRAAVPDSSRRRRLFPGRAQGLRVDPLPGASLLPPAGNNPCTGFPEPRVWNDAVARPIG